MNTQNLTLIISSMTCGGAERVMSIIANALSQKSRWKVTLLTLDQNNDSFYPLKKEVIYKPLNLYQKSSNPLMGLLNNLKRITKLRRAIKRTKPDVILSFIDQTNILSLISGMGIAPVVVSERIHPARHSIGKLWSRLRVETYPTAAVVVAQVEDSANWIEENLKVKSFIIPNPIDKTTLIPRKKKRFKRVIASGRLVPQKGFDLLIDAFYIATREHKDWSLSIFGEGPLNSDLQKQIDKRGLGSQIILEGRTDEMFEELSKSDIFALSSRYEGFPNALLEAMASGLACVAFDCPSGPRDMIVNNENGLLVPDENVEEFSLALTTLFNDKKRCRKLGENAVHSTEEYSVEKNIEIWHNLLQTVIEKNGSP